MLKYKVLITPNGNKFYYTVEDVLKNWVIIFDEKLNTLIQCQIYGNNYFIYRGNDIPLCEVI